MVDPFEISVPIGAAAIAFLFGYLQHKYNQDKLLLEAFKELNGNAYRNARIRVVRLYSVTLDEVVNRNEAKKLDEKKKILRDLDAYKSSDPDERVTALEQESRNIVKYSFEEVGILFTPRKLLWIFKVPMIPTNQFLEVYWYTIIICYQALEDDIKSIAQKTRIGEDHYMPNFRGLYNEACRFAKEKKGYDPNLTKTNGIQQFRNYKE